MRFGRRGERLQRWLIKPVGYLTLAMALAATGGVLALTRWPAVPSSMPAFSLIDFQQCPLFPPRPRHWSEITADYLFAAGISLWLVVAGIWALRMLLRWGIIWICRVPRAEWRMRPGRTMLFLGLALLTMLAIGFGWPYRAGHSWVTAQATANAHAAAQFSPRVNRRDLLGGYTNASNVPCPWPLSWNQQLDVIRTAVCRGPSSERTVAIQILVKQWPEDVFSTLSYALARESDPGLRELELHIMSLYRCPASAEIFAVHMTDPDPGVRAAAADGLGILRGPVSRLPADPALPMEMRLNSQVAIGPSLLCWGDEFDRMVRLGLATPDDVALPVPAHRRDTLERMMLEGASSQEREAAARALIAWPPAHYSLRVAEWGVWIADTAGNLKVIKEELDEIPPFVHTMGDPAHEVIDRLSPSPMNIFKPIFHMTADVPMSVDVQVMISAGRPCFAYPMADDFTLGIGETPLAASLDDPKLKPMASTVAGYPWASATWQGFSHHSQVTSLGLRWQSLIVSPQQLPWMHPPVVGSDPRYQWWGRLRQVPCSWVSSRGEAERFLYYDGPTLARTPVIATLGEAPAGGADAPPHLKLRVLDPDHEVFCIDMRAQFINSEEPATTAPSHERQGLFIRVHDDQAVGYTVEIPASSTESAVVATTPARGEAVAGLLHEMLMRAGLSATEADGLIACWRPQFLAAEGSRFLLVMSAADYDALCPLRIRPAPTEVARVGLVLTEFGAAQSAGK